MPWIISENTNKDLTQIYLCQFFSLLLLLFSLFYSIAVLMMPTKLSKIFEKKLLRSYICPVYHREIFITWLKSYCTCGGLFWVLCFVQFQKFGTFTRYDLQTLKQRSEMIKTKKLIALSANCFFYRYYNGNSGTRWGL